MGLFQKYNFIQKPTNIICRINKLKGKKLAPKYKIFDKFNHNFMMKISNTLKII